jgi:hypothetical protein
MAGGRHRAGFEAPTVKHRAWYPSDPGSMDVPWSTPYHYDPPTRHRGRTRRLLGAVVALAAVLGVVVYLLWGRFSFPQTNTAPRAATSPTATPVSALPAFADWRAAYFDQDGHLHAVTADGHTNVVGINLPFLGSGDRLDAASVSPNGHLIAYSIATTTSLTLVDLVAAPGPSGPVNILADEGSDTLQWSPDGSILALVDGAGISLLRVRGNQVSPGSPIAATDLQIVGWIDGAHLAVVKVVGSETHLDAFDIATGGLRLIASFSTAQLGAEGFAISPDGKEALLSNCQFAANPFTPMLATIDTATGVIHSLPQSLAAAGRCLSHVAFLPGTSTVAVSNGSLQEGDLTTWVIDTQRDRATLLRAGVYALGWMPGGALVVGTVAPGNNASGPGTLSAVTFAADGTPSSVTLTRTALAFLGVVRTA